MKLNLLLMMVVLAVARCEMPSMHHINVSNAAIAQQQSGDEIPKGAKEERRFISAELSPDGVTGVFVFKREVFYEGGIGLFFSGEPRRYIIDRNIIGSYELQSGEVRILHRADNIGGQGNFYIHSIFGKRILLFRSFSGELRNKHYWLNMTTGVLTFIPLQEEMAARGRELGQYYLVDENGTLVFENKSLKDGFKTSSNTEIWLRRSSGEYERIAEIPPMSEGYYNFKDEKIYFYSAAQRSAMLYDLDSRSFRKVNPKDIPYRTFDKTIGFQVDSHGSPQPQIGRKIDGKWQYQEAQINTNILR